MGNCCDDYSYHAIHSGNETTFETRWTCWKKIKCCCGLLETTFETRWTCWKKIKCCCGLLICVVVGVIVFAVVYGVMHPTCGIENAESRYDFTSLGTKSYLLLASTPTWKGWIAKQNNNYIISIPYGIGTIQTGSPTTITWTDGQVISNGSTNMYETFQITPFVITLSCPQNSCAATVHVLFSCGGNCKIYGQDESTCVQTPETNKWVMYQTYYNTNSSQLFVTLTLLGNGISLQGIAIS